MPRGAARVAAAGHDALVGDDLAVVHMQTPREHGGDVLIVGDQHQRGAVGGKPMQELDDLLPERESRLPVGSSARMIRGRFASARAIATRWRSPPDSCWRPVVIR